MSLFNVLQSIATQPAKEDYKFLYKQQPIGHTPAPLVPHFSVSQLFQVDQVEKTIRFTDEAMSAEERTNQLRHLTSNWRSQQVHFALSKWRNEEYAVRDHDDQLVCFIERTACGLFGFAQFGCHLNAFVVDRGELKVWVAKRSATKQTYPGMLDNTAAGRISHLVKVDY